MGFLKPKNLSFMAAKIFIENVILDSHLFKQFHRVTKLLISHTAIDDIQKDLHTDEIDKNVHVIMNLMDQVLGRCSQKTKDDILKTIRTTNHHCSSGAIILQFLYDSEVILQKKHWVVCSLIPSLRPCFPSVEKFVFDWYGWKNSISLLKRLLPLLPNLKVFKCVVTNHTSFLLPLRNSCPNLVDLALCVKQGFFTSDQLSNLFFCGKSIDSVKRSYVRLENVKLSFPNLKIFSFNGTSFEQYDFFKMFLHFYNKTSLGVGLYYTKMYMESVSWFDAVLSHSVVINPDSSISQCELNINDLFLPFFERSLLSWKNLRCLLLSLGVQGKKTPATSSKIGLRLESLFEKQKRIDYLCIRISGPVNDEELSELLYPTLKKHGNRLKKLKIFGIVNFLSHKSIFQMLNFCPNIRNLTIIGRRITKFSKDIRLKNLSHLESLTVIWSEFDPNSNCPMFNSKLIVDILRCSPNLKYFYSTANLMLLEYMTKIQFGSRLENLVIHFQTEREFEGVPLLMKTLTRLPKLQELVVRGTNLERDCDCCHFESEESCLCHEFDESVYIVLKSFTDKTQIYLRYYSFEDTQVAMYL